MILALVIQILDLRGDLALLSPWHQGAFLLLVSLVGVVSFRGPNTPPPWRFLTTLALILSVALASIALIFDFSEHRLRSAWAHRGKDRLVAPIREIRQEFDRFLAGLLEIPSSWRAGAPAASRLERFRDLERRVLSRGESRDRYGWTLWHSGELDSWAGRSSVALGARDASGEKDYRVIQSGASVFLVATAPLGEGYTLQGEYLLQSPLEKQPYLPLPTLAKIAGEERVFLRPIREDEPAFAAGSTRQSEVVRWDEPAGGPAVASLSLRQPGGLELAVVRIQDSRVDAVSAKLLDGCQLAGTILTLLTMGIAASRLLHRSFRTRRSALSFLGFTLVLWTGRLLLLAFHDLLRRFPLFDPGRFACWLAWDLLMSPADLFLTALFLGIQVCAWDCWAAECARGSSRRSLLAWIHLPALALLGAFLIKLSGEAPRDASFELLRMEFSPPDWARLLVQGGLFVFAASWLALAATAIRLFRSAPGSAPSRLPAAARFYLFVALATLLYLPIVGRSAIRQREEFFSSKLLDRVERHQVQRRDLLKGVLDRIHSSPEIGEILERHSGEGLAYLVWAATRLDEIGLSSSLRVYSGEGTLVGRFGLNLPVKMEARFPPSGEEGSIRRIVAPLGVSRKKVLVGEASRAVASGATLRFQVHLLDEYENLPFLRADNLYVQLFPRPRTQETNPELLGSEPLVVVYDPAGERVYSSLEAGPDLPRAAARMAPQEERWETLRVGESSYRTRIKKTAERIFAVGFLLPSGLEEAGAFVRTTLLGLLIAGVVWILVHLVAAPSRGAPRRQSPFFKRLVAMILAASLLPLFLLSFFLHRFVVREMNENLREEGLSSLSVARRIVSDYLAGEGESQEPEVDDDVAFWLRSVVRQDINLYLGDRLSATSAREIYASGLLPTRLNAQVYEKLILRRESSALSEERLGTLKYQTISAPLPAGGDPRGILSLPLAEKRQEILRKRADVEEAILIVTVGMLFLLTVLAHFLARRVSEPVVALSEAARRIESGDYDAEVSVFARDETALLIESFNRMAASLRRQREDLRQRTDYIEKILLNATTGVISTRPDGLLVTINPAARFLLGLPDERLEGELLASVLERQSSLAPLREILADSQPGKERSWQIRMEGGAKPLTLQVASLPFRESPDSPAGRILLLEDLTDTLRSSRLEAWAEMARRIAHEIKNPLTPIQLSVDHLRRVHRSGDSRFETILEDCLNTIQKQVRNLRTIAGEFSDYARIPEVRRERVPTLEIVEEVLAPLRAAPPAGIRLESSVVPGTPDLFVDRSLTRRALLNLVQNALEAMPAGGTLSLTAERSGIAGNHRPPRVQILISDTGGGMDAPTLARLFEPYFSTKELGTGLGLSIVRKTVEEQGGRVEVRSQPGAGTQVLLDLPAADGEPPEDRAKSIPEGG
jgi:signal transduction histidine kinase/HAMP domain-containing protein